MNDATQMGDVKTLLAPCLNWVAVLRSLLMLLPKVPLIAIWLKSQVGLKVLHELRLRVIDHREWKILHSRCSCQGHHRGYWSLSLTTVYTGSAITV